MNDHFNTTESNTQTEEIEEADEIVFSNIEENEPSTPNIIGNSLSSLLTSSTWSTNTSNIDNCEQTEPNKTFERSDSCTTSISKISNQKYSYNAILKKHETERIIDWTDVWKKFEGSVSLQNQNNEETNEPEFEVVSNPQSEIFSLENVRNMVELASQMGVEKGLDQQGFLCNECAHPIGIHFAEARYYNINIFYLLYFNFN